MQPRKHHLPLSGTQSVSYSIYAKQACFFQPAVWTALVPSAFQDTLMPSGQLSWMFRSSTVSVRVLAAYSACPAACGTPRLEAAVEIEAVLTAPAAGAAVVRLCIQHDLIAQHGTWHCCWHTDESFAAFYQP